MDFWIYLVLFVAPLIGGLLAFYFKPKVEGKYKLLLSFSGAYLFSVAVLHFFPVIFSSEHIEHAGVYVLLGFFLQLLLEQLTRGLEHGHFHVHHDHHPSFVYTVMLGICIHSFFDGIPVFSGEHHGHNHSMLSAMALHKLPEGYALVVLLGLLNIKTSTSFILLFLYSLVAPAGAMAASYFDNQNPHILMMMYALVGGLILHVSTTILFESESGQHRFTYQKIAAVGLGSLLAYLTSI
ncbi:MAG: ZIP family metal transporter [Bacteroidota bacterium]|jgi:zinc transporter ZupT